MLRDLKIMGCALLVIVIAFVCFMMFGGTSFRSDNVNSEKSNIEENVDSEETDNGLEESVDFEQDVMNDLELFFNGGEGYEYLDGEAGFTNFDVE